MAAAMTHDDGMFRRYFVEVGSVEVKLVFHLRVIEEISFDPHTSRRFAGSRAELLDDTGDGDELDLERIADQDFVEQGVARRVIVAIDKAGHDGHLFCIKYLCVFPRERFDLMVASNEDEPAGADRERRGPRWRVHRVYLCVDDHEVGVLSFEEWFGARSAKPRKTFPFLEISSPLPASM